MRIALLVALIACGKDSDKPVDLPVKPDLAKPKPKPSTPTPTESETKPEPKPTPAQPGLTAVMDGKAIAVRSVNAAWSSDGQITIELKNYDESCDRLTTGSSARNSEPTDLDLTLRVGRFLHADGTLGWAIRGIYWHPSRDKGSWTKQVEKESGGDPFPKQLALDAGAGTSFEVPLAIELAMDDEDLGKQRTLSVKGTAKATGCGDAKLRRDRELASPQAATITIANQELPIRGAALAVKRSGERELVVATGEVSCVEGTDYASAKWPDVEIHLTWGPEGKAWSAARAGSWVDWAGNADFGTLSATPNRPGTANELAIKLAGATTIKDYAVALKGTIRARVCRAPKP